MRPRGSRQVGRVNISPKAEPVLEAEFWKDEPKTLPALAV